MSKVDKDGLRCYSCLCIESETYTCEACWNIHCNKCINRCSICLSVLCSHCSWFCESETCNEIICDNNPLCSVECGVCYKKLCNDHSKFCSNCGTMKCNKCFGQKFQNSCIECCVEEKAEMRNRTGKTSFSFDIHRINNKE